jgi:GcrA cell cycle regulator
MIWSDERVELLKKLWADGLSGGEIAILWNVSRNTICGKVHRLGLSNEGRGQPGPKRMTRPDPSSAVFKARPVSIGAVKPARLVPGSIEQVSKPVAVKRASFAALPGTEPRPFDERPRTGCKWPIEGGPELLACCAQITRGGYCDDHAAKAFAAVGRFHDGEIALRLQNAADETTRLGGIVHDCHAWKTIRRDLVEGREQAVRQLSPQP